MDDGKSQIQLPEPGILDTLLSVLFPLRCVHCGAAGAWLCGTCGEVLRPVGPRHCRRCGKPGRHDSADCPECRGRRLPFETASAAFCFEGPARSLVHSLKYGGQRRLAGFMAGISTDFACLTAAGKEVTLTYVPLHRSKAIARGYNQAEFYAKALSRRYGLLLRGLLVKRHSTLPQNRLGFAERGKNLSGCFSLKKGARVSGDRVVLIDDVYTTGSTVAECAGILRRDLDVTVDVWTFARTVKSQRLIADIPGIRGHTNKRRRNR